MDTPETTQVTDTRPELSDHNPIIRADHESLRVWSYHGEDDSNLSVNSLSYHDEKLCDIYWIRCLIYSLEVQQEQYVEVGRKGSF